mmetsp:Transcript_742/g.2839  ORF Transcript_742/g.2839 Transcript_742/m.2839 type:complete len:254 (-) Transcript_742:447-1208(-)
MEAPKSDVQALGEYCASYSAARGQAPQWNHKWENGECSSMVEIGLLGVPHKFNGGARASEGAAAEDTARRVLWYLQCPGYENAFSLDPRAPAVSAKAIPAPPVNWASDAAEDCALQMAERKTALMKVQNRLQQSFARQLRPGQSVWEWTYETDEEDSAWPPLCRATVNIPVAGRRFTGGWARGQRDAQIEACNLVTSFLSESSGGNGPLSRFPSGASSSEVLSQLEGLGGGAAGSPSEIGRVSSSSDVEASVF